MTLENLHQLLQGKLFYDEELIDNTKTGELSETRILKVYAVD